MAGVRFPWLVTFCIPLSASLASLVACSGAGNQDLFEGNATASDISFNEPETPSGTTTAPAASTETEGADAGPSSPAPPTPPPPADAGTADAAPAETCTLETEPNNTMATPNAFTTCFRGEVESSKDVEYGRFTMPATAREVRWTHDDDGGKVAFRFFLNGVPVLTKNNKLVAPIPGATYLVQVRTTQSRPTWELRLTFE